MKDGAFTQIVRRASVGVAAAAVLLITVSLQAQTPTSGVAEAAKSVQPSEMYGLGCLAPALVAVVLAILTRQVLLSLALGILTASGMSCICQGEYNPLVFVTAMMDRYVFGVLAPRTVSGVDYEHLKILVYTFLLGATIGVVNGNGSTRGLVERVTRRIRTRQSAQVGGIFAGLLVFIDDYASAMVVGPGLRPIFDRLRISREKLAHIVNWTAAPDSSLFLSTWLAVQISNIDSGLKSFGANTPGFLAGRTGGSIFWECIPYRTYTLLVFAALLLLALTGRDFGAMRKAQSRAAAGETADDGGVATESSRTSHWSLAVIPGVALVGLMLWLMGQSGYEGCLKAGAAMSFAGASEIWQSLQAILNKADAHFALLYASLTAAALAIALSVASRSLSLSKTMDAALDGMKHTFGASVILVLAWGLSRASQDLQLNTVAADYLKSRIDAHVFSLAWLPLASFATACLISFSTGTSWGTMSILVPAVVAISGALAADQPAGQAMPLFLATVGATMAGAVFGNTCSPLADVTVLSAMFSGCDMGRHVRTLFPYAMWVAVTSVLCTDGVRWAMERWAPSVYTQHWSVWYGLVVGAVLLYLFIMIVGRRPKGVVVEPAVLFVPAPVESGPDRPPPAI